MTEPHLYAATPDARFYGCGIRVNTDAELATTQLGQIIDAAKLAMTFLKDGDEATAEFKINLTCRNAEHSHESSK